MFKKRRVGEEANGREKDEKDEKIKLLRKKHRNQHKNVAESPRRGKTTRKRESEREQERARVK